MKVLYFGTYNPDYSRNRVLINGLRQNGVEVVECRDNAPGIRKFINLFNKHRQFKNQYDVMVVGFLGQQIVPFAKLITRKPIVFDAFLSLYDSNVFDRKTVKKISIRAGYYWVLDWLSMYLADVVLFDTDAHINYASAKFMVSREKFKRIFVGTDDKIFYPRENPSNSVFTVYFHGSFIPLQGVDRIVEAAKILEKEDIKFNILGNGQTFSEVKKIAEKLGIRSINFISRVDYNKLPEYIGESDVCLGIFGKTSKAGRVIPNKIYEYAAMARPIVTLDTLAIRELFTEEDMILIKNDPRELADKIIALRNDEQMRSRFGQNAYKKILSSATPKILGAQLSGIINSQIIK